MTPKEKAEHLVLKFTNLINFDLVSDLKWHSPTDDNRNMRVNKDAKQCALITVDEILHIYANTFVAGVNYWKEVKQEINNL